jgi:hypothetical protein
MSVSDYAEKAILDWALLGATPTRPTVIGVGLATALPTDSTSGEVGTGSGYTRQTCTFAAASSPAGTTDNANAMTFGPFSTACTILGAHIWDTLAATAGNQLWNGSIATARTLIAGDSFVFAVGALDVTLA